MFCASSCQKAIDFQLCNVSLLLSPTGLASLLSISAKYRLEIMNMKERKRLQKYRILRLPTVANRSDHLKD